MGADWGFPGIENAEFICLGLHDKQGFCLKSGCVICFTVWEYNRRKQLAGRKLDARPWSAPWAGRQNLPCNGETGGGGEGQSR